MSAASQTATIMTASSTANPVMTQQEQIAAITAQRDELRECLAEMLKGFEAGVFVRNIEGDGERDWAVKLLPFIRTLGRAQAAVLLAGQEGK